MNCAVLNIQICKVRATKGEGGTQLREFTQETIPRSLWVLNTLSLTSRDRNSFDLYLVQQPLLKRISRFDDGLPANSLQVDLETRH